MSPQNRQSLDPMPRSQVGMGTTVLSMISGIADADEATRKQQLDRFFRQYGAPLTQHLMRRTGMDAAGAEELVQDFVVDKLLLTVSHANLAKKYLEQQAACPRSFRPYLLRSLNNYVIDRYRSRSKSVFSFEEDLAVGSIREQDRFDIDWASNLLRQTIQRVRDECDENDQSQIWQIFEARVIEPLRHGGEPVDFDQLARSLGLSCAKDASNRFRTGVRKFNRILRESIRNYLPLSDIPLDDPAIEQELTDLRDVLANAHGLPLHELSQPELPAPPAQAASLFGLFEPGDGEPASPCLAAQWTGLLNGPLQAVLLSLPEDGEITTLRELWEHPSPPLPYLVSLKQQAKRAVLLETKDPGPFREGDPLPYQINVVLYSTAIALAQLRHGQRLTRDSNARVAPRLHTILDYPWLDPLTRRILADWLMVVRELESRSPDP